MTTLPRLRVAATPSPQGPLKVLYLIDSLGPGGAERLMVDLLPCLARLGIDSEVVAIQERHGNPIGRELEQAGIPVSLIGIERLRERGALAKVTAAIQAARPDIVHTQLEFADILGTIAARRLGIPSVCTIHTLDRPRRWSRDAARFRLMAWTLRRRSDRVFAVSESARRHVLQKAGLRRRRTRTIHNGIDLGPFLAVDPAQRSTTRVALGIGTDDPTIATVAVLRPAKGIDDMITAMPQLVAEHPGLRYLVVGDGPHRDSLEAQVASAGLGRSVQFLGHRTDIADVLGASDVFVLPSLTEALPTVVIEAMAAGLPVVATDVGGTSELVDAGISGILVPARSPDRLGEAIDRLLRSPRQRSAMGMAARRIAVERFSIERQAGRLAAEYRVLAEAGRQR